MGHRRRDERELTIRFDLGNSTLAKLSLLVDRELRHAPNRSAGERGRPYS
jgi:hypothetical protein